MPIYSHHPQFAQMQKRFERMQDVTDGQDAIKQKGEVYLPKPNPDNLSAENRAFYQNYLSRAVFVEITKDTLDKYVGQVFADDPILNVDAPFAYLRQNADGAGASVYQIAQKAFIDLMRFGRCGVFVDYPETSGELSSEQAKRLGLEPRLLFYGAQQIINWRVQRVGGKQTLTMVVLAETAQIPDDDDPFVYRAAKLYRHLGLDEMGFFVDVWLENDGEVEQIGWRVYPTDSKGRRFDFIPFAVMGADTNDFALQSIPLESLALMNLAHYRNSADYEDSVFRCGQVQPYLVNVDEHRLRHLEKTGVHLGSGNVLLLGENSGFHFAQASPNVLAGDAMDAKMQIMRELGAKLAQSGAYNKTATQSMHENAMQNSAASMCVANVNEAMDKAIRFAYAYIGQTPPLEALFKAKQEFSAPTADPGLLSSLLALYQAGVLPRQAIFAYLRKYGLVDGELSDDDLAGMIEADGGFLNQLND